MPYDFDHEAMCCVNELFYRDGPNPKPLDVENVAYMKETIERYMREAHAAGPR